MSGKAHSQIAEHLGLKDWFVVHQILKRERRRAESEVVLPRKKSLPFKHGPSTLAALKAECIYRQKIDSFEQAGQLISEYIQFYNYQRIQLKSKLTPYEKRCQLA